MSIKSMIYHQVIMAIWVERNVHDLSENLNILYHANDLALPNCLCVFYSSQQFIEGLEIYFHPNHSQGHPAN